MKRIERILWGSVLIAIGVISALKIFDVISIDLFFEGWWTLFIIVPCFIGLFGNGSKKGNLIGILIGVVLLLGCRDVLSFGLILKLTVPVILIIVGLSIIFKDSVKREITKEIDRLNKNRNGENEHYSVFGGDDIKLDNEEFKGAGYNAIFGGIECDLRNAVINEDVVINCTSVFGGIDIFVPDDVNIKVKSTSFFGGVGNKTTTRSADAQKTLYVNAICIFGGVDVK